MDATMLDMIVIDSFDLLPQDLVDEMRDAATAIQNGGWGVESANGSKIDYQTLLVLTSRFANDTATHTRAKWNIVQRNRQRDLY